jgi:hypothetical protein
LSVLAGPAGKPAGAKPPRRSDSGKLGNYCETRDLKNSFDVVTSPNRCVHPIDQDGSTNTNQKTDNQAKSKLSRAAC